MDRSQLRPGDLLFYKSTLDGTPGTFDGLAADDFEQSFEALAAFAQGLPYHVVDGRYRPWYHIAICVEGGSEPWAVGFNALSLGGDDIGRVEEYELGDGPKDPVFLPATPNESNIGIEVIRLATSTVGAEIDIDAIVNAARGQVGEVDYSVAGLIGYALATNAWTLPDHPERERLLAQARGADLRSRRAFPNAETCTTMITRALKAGGVELTIAEPPVPKKRPNLDKQTRQLFDSIRATLARVRGGRLNDGSNLEQLDQARVLSNGLEVCRSLGEPTGRCVTPEAEAADPAASSLLEAANYMMSQLRTDGVMADSEPRELTFQLTVSSPAGETDQTVGFELVDVNTNDTPVLNRLATFESVALQVPGTVVGDVGNYITVMEQAHRMLLDGVDPKDLEAEGQAVMSTPIRADSYLVSPAMVWEALQPYAS